MFAFVQQLEKLVRRKTVNDVFWSDFYAGKVSVFAFGKQCDAEFIPARTKGGILVFQNEEEAKRWGEKVSVNAGPEHYILKRVTHFDLVPYIPTHGNYLVIPAQGSLTASASASRSAPRDRPDGE